MATPRNTPTPKDVHDARVSREDARNAETLSSDKDSRTDGQKPAEAPVSNDTPSAGGAFVPVGTVGATDSLVSETVASAANPRTATQLPAEPASGVFQNVPDVADDEPQIVYNQQIVNPDGTPGIKTHGPMPVSEWSDYERENKL